MKSTSIENALTTGGASRQAGRLQIRLSRTQPVMLLRTGRVDHERHNAQRGRHICRRLSG